MPNKKSIMNKNMMRLFSNYLYDPNIWHVHRRSSAGGAAIGVFCAFIPLPIQTISAVAFAIIFRVNLPISILFSLLTNPFTIPFIFLSSYKVGLFLLRVEDSNIMQLSLNNKTLHEWFGTQFIHIWQPLVAGCLILGLISAIFTYFTVRILWRLSAITKWSSRNKK